LHFLLHFLFSCFAPVALGAVPQPHAQVFFFPGTSVFSSPSKVCLCSTLPLFLVQSPSTSGFCYPLFSSPLILKFFPRKPLATIVNFLSSLLLCVSPLLCFFPTARMIFGFRQAAIFPPFFPPSQRLLRPDLLLPRFFSPFIFKLLCQSHRL